MTIIKLYKFALAKLAAALTKTSALKAKESTKLFKLAETSRKGADAALAESNKLAEEARKVSALI